MTPAKLLKEKITYGLIALLVFLTPLFFLPTTPDFYSWNKRVLILATGIILMLIWAGVSVFKKESSIEVKRKGTLPLICGLLVITALSIFLNPGPMEGLMGYGILFLGLSFIYFFLTQIEDFSLRYIFYPLLGSSLLLSLISILGNVGVLARVLPWENINYETWSPAGGQFAQLTWILIAFALAVFYLIKYTQKDQRSRQNTKNIVSTAEALIIGFSIPLLVVALALFGINYHKAGVNLRQEQSPELEIQRLQESGPYINLPYRFGWEIATTSLGKSLKNTFVGIGPNNFSSAYRRFKPLEIVVTPLWQVTFPSSSNVPFQLLTTLGILGFGVWLLIAVKAFTYVLGKFRSTEELDACDLGLISILIIQVFLPPTVLLWLLLFVFLATTKMDRTEEAWVIKSSTGLLIALALAGGLTYLTFRAYRGEVFYRQSLEALQEGDGISTYNLQQRAIQANPRKVSYRVGFSNTNSILAQSLLEDLNQQLTPQQQQQPTIAQQGTEQLDREQEQLRNQINSLIQQSIEQAQAGTSLNPQDAQTWMNLAETYSSLQAVMDGADEWALRAYGQAIQLDPFNPVLRLQRGSLNLMQGNDEDAIINFRTAVQIRPRYANGWYNLAQAYRKTQDFPKAAQALENVLTILTPDHEDYAQVEEELEDVKSKLSAEEQQMLQEDTENIEDLPSPDEDFSEPSEPTPSAAPEVQGETTYSPFSE